MGTLYLTIDKHFLVNIDLINKINNVSSLLFLFFFHRMSKIASVTCLFCRTTTKPKCKFRVLFVNHNRKYF